ncbi:MAG TPA: crossover junction endodeoxyribonuclease RuvC [Novosphingobium sp.]|jgi:crossover junction endodeoxyribonuclease RuvC|nr:crossover junction endodeoxyribonuclease RuvC [Novosphingobium sp.]HOA49730.1 crossover junction endodeoxyribonuclease RuvC [Novosphingobium sp.]HQE00611.1 crossover junction endodeoxyribonuclease RuvC [Novosphingobium sp.]
MLIIGIDPSLTCTGWGIVAKSGNRLTHVANGQVKTDAALPLADRLVTLDRELTDVILRHRPDSGAVEEVFVNKNPQSTLKLGHARGVCLLALARAGLPVHEYATRLVKKAIVGTGAAEKAQVQAMLKVLLPGVKLAGADAADALAVAIAHAHLAGTAAAMAR